MDEISEMYGWTYKYAETNLTTNRPGQVEVAEKLLEKYI